MLDDEQVSEQGTCEVLGTSHKMVELASNEVTPANLMLRSGRCASPHRAT